MKKQIKEEIKTSKWTKIIFDEATMLSWYMYNIWDEMVADEQTLNVLDLVKAKYTKI
jgi:hypothetical protein